MNLNFTGIEVEGYKIGVTKNHIIIILPSICRRSRKRTLRAENIRTSPVVITTWIIITMGKAIKAIPILTLKSRRKTNRIGRLRIKLAKLEKTVTTGRTCGGNNTLVMRSLPLIIEFAPSKIDVEKQTQGSSPQNKNTG